MEDKIEGVKGVIGEWIDEIEKMKKLKSPFAHLIIDPVEVSTEQAGLQKKDCSDESCCGKC